MKSRVSAGKVMLNELLKTTMMKLIGDFLERCNILQYLIEPTANALSILRNETWDAAGRNDTYHQNDTVQNPADESHNRLTKL
jgi:hypothetical protein